MEFSMTTLPVYHELMNPTLQALRELGGSGTIHEIYDKVTEIMQLPDEVLDVIHNPNRGTQTEVEYRLSWARTYLKQYGMIDNSTRGVWSLTDRGQETQHVNPTDVVRFVREELQQRNSGSETEKSASAIEPNNLEDIEEELIWQDELLGVVREMDAAAFERLSQRLLREAGFTQVEVTGRSGDGGIDGKGILRIGGFLSFHVIFQCKRYTGSVSAGQVRDFRGAMMGRADKGLLITTGHFTREAVKEATRDGASAIDLIDGELLALKLKELSLGVRTRIVETEDIEIDEGWFAKI
jgi:restriction system protein